MLPDAKNRAKELAAMLDKLCAGGSGHINVTGSGAETQVQTQNSLDGCKNMACCVPTLHKGIDDEKG